ncbi:MAG: C-lysozyme inhibitor [Acetobacter sp.]|nr:C-lysozyme inhibitor [Acetobacter sp.]
MKMILKRILLMACVMIPLSAFAADPETLSVWKKNHSWAVRFDTLFETVKKPVWLNGATESEPVKVTLGGHPWTVLMACKRHDCGNHQVVVMFNDVSMYGLLFETKDNSSEEILNWLNLDGNQDSMDVKTILYAAISGSLFNHPKNFMY